jgi:chaperonin cofactor prefoldin
MLLYLFFGCVLVYLLVSVFQSREYLTLQEVDTEGKALDKRVTALESEYSAIQQKLDSQQSTMKAAGDQAAAAKASISASRGSTK